MLRLSCNGAAADFRIPSATKCGEKTGAATQKSGGQAVLKKKYCSREEEEKMRVKKQM